MDIYARSIIVTIAKIVKVLKKSEMRQIMLSQKWKPPNTLWPVLNYFVQKLFLRSVLALNQQKTLSMARMILSYLQIFANFKFQHDFQPIFALKLVRIKKLLFLAKHYGHFFSRYVM